MSVALTLPSSWWQLASKHVRKPIWCAQMLESPRQTDLWVTYISNRHSNILRNAGLAQVGCVTFFSPFTTIDSSTLGTLFSTLSPSSAHHPPGPSLILWSCKVPTTQVKDQTKAYWFCFTCGDHVRCVHCRYPRSPPSHEPWCTRLS